jgi:hypothetical protein
MITNDPQPTPVTGGVVNLFYREPNELVVVTTSRIEIFDVTKVFQPKLKSSSVVFPSAQSPLDACLRENGDFFILMLSDQNNHIVRVLNPNLGNRAQFTWATLFGEADAALNTLFPLAVRCAEQEVFVAAEIEDDTGVWIGRIGDELAALNPVLLRQPQYFLKDLIVDSDSSRVLTLFNRNSLQNNSSDSILRVSSFAEEFTEATYAVGSSANALSSFVVNSKSYFGVFVGDDYRASGISPPKDQILQFEGSSAGAGLTLLANRGEGAASFDSSLPIFSRWVHSKLDHYVYGLFSAGGVGLISDSPRLEIPQVINLDLSASADIEFTFRADRDVTVEIRLIDDLNPQGETLGLQINRGLRIQQFSAIANQEVLVKVSADQIKTKQERNLRLLLLASDKNRPEASVARRGLAFNFDRPPPPVKNLALGFGDRSLHVFFQLPFDPGDIDYFLIFMANDELAIENLPSNLSELTEQWGDQMVSGFGEASFANPIKVLKSNWRGVHRIAPLNNGEDWFVRVLVVDRASNFSSENPSGVSSRARSTLNLEKAFGSGSCSLETTSKASPSGFLTALCLFLILYLALYRRLFLKF